MADPLGQPPRLRRINQDPERMGRSFFWPYRDAEFPSAALPLPEPFHSTSLQAFGPENFYDVGLCNVSVTVASESLLTVGVISTSTPLKAAFPLSSSSS